MTYFKVCDIMKGGLIKVDCDLYKFQKIFEKGIDNTIFKWYNVNVVININFQKEVRDCLYFQFDLPVHKTYKLHNLNKK